MKNALNFRASLKLVLLLTLASVAPRMSGATVVEFQTVMGNFEVNLYDNATPQTVANFLNYVNNGAYTSSVIHRSVPGFVVQGGGFSYGLGFPPVAIPANPAVTNEPVFANVRGTIAMAKIAGNPNSATNQWFFNLSDNSTGLDGQNGGFTVFGEVVGSGMDVLDAIAALERFAFAPPLGELPLQNYTNADFSLSVPPDGNNLILVTDLIISDSTVDSAAGLSPPANTANTGGGTPTPPASSGGGGGGSFGLFALFALMLVYRRRKF